VGSEVAGARVGAEVSCPTTARQRRLIVNAIPIQPLPTVIVVGFGPVAAALPLRISLCACSQRRRERRLTPSHRNEVVNGPRGSLAMDCGRAFNMQNENENRRGGSGGALTRRSGTGGPAVRRSG